MDIKDNEGEIPRCNYSESFGNYTLPPGNPNFAVIIGSPLSVSRRGNPVYAIVTAPNLRRCIERQNKEPILAASPSLKAYHAYEDVLQGSDFANSEYWDIPNDPREHPMAKELMRALKCAGFKLTFKEMR